MFDVINQKVEILNYLLSIIFSLHLKNFKRSYATKGNVL